MRQRFVLILLLLSSAAFAAPPAIGTRGVVNAASYKDPGLPNGSIAQGSIFDIFGANLGPATAAGAASLPLTTTLGGTSVAVTIGGTNIQCFMIYASAGQVAAILPSTTPIGTGTITVSFGGATSATAPITVAKSSFGIFTINQQGSGQAVIQDGNYNFNSATFAFQPNETVVAWGTGLGPIAGSDATTPPTGNLPGINVSVTVGGLPATVTYAGRSGYSGDDQVAFTIPSGVTGCNVPLAIVVSNADGSNPVASNYATIAIGPTTTCTSQTSTTGAGGVTRIGTVLLNHSVTTSPTANLTGGFTSTTTTSDFVEASFTKLTETGPAASSYDFTYGTCAIINNPPAAMITSTPLDGGPVVNINGPNGAKAIPVSTFSVGSYFEIVGGGSPLPGQTAPPLYFSPGTYSATNGSGGKDVGGFNVNITVPPAFTWTNYSSITSITRSTPLTVDWTGGDPSWDVFLIGSSSLGDGASVSFECLARDSDQTLTVPASILEALPVSASNSGIPSGALTMVVSSPTPATTSVTGLDFFTYGFSFEYQNSGLAFK